ncbi:unnamed protein product, partial [Polarella glacialis]
MDSHEKLQAKRMMATMQQRSKELSAEAADSKVRRKEKPSVKAEDLLPQLPQKTASEGQPSDKVIKAQDKQSLTDLVQAMAVKRHARRGGVANRSSAVEKPALRQILRSSQAGPSAETEASGSAEVAAEATSSAAPATFNSNINNSNSNSNNSNATASLAADLASPILTFLYPAPDTPRAEAATFLTAESSDTPAVAPELEAIPEFTHEVESETISETAVNSIEATGDELLPTNPDATTTTQLEPALAPAEDH